MLQLKKQIKESFFNPILYFLPVMIFMVFNEYFSTNVAWRFSIPVAFILLLYVYFIYHRLFLWFIVVFVGYLVVGIGSSILSENSGNFVLVFLDEFLFIGMSVLILASKNKLDKFFTKKMTRKNPMSNNVNELCRVVKVLLIITVSFVIINLLIYYSAIDDTFFAVSRLLYLVSLILLTIYESFRVIGVRNKLLKEDWLPIVSKDGRVIGSSQYQPGVKMDKNLMYPVVRFYFVENGALLLYKRGGDENTDPGLWDASDSRHIRISESIHQALHNLSKNHYNIDADDFLMLSRYEYVGNFNRQLIHLFVSCNTKELKMDDKFSTDTKWWLPNQIEDNLDSGIFSDRFIKEYGMIRRSGLLDNQCDCECVLKNTIYNLNKG